MFVVASAAPLLVPADGVRTAEGTRVVSLELALDLRRRLPLKALFSRFAVVFELEDPSESLELEELDELDEVDEPNISASTPGWDSSSITCWGVLVYI